MSVTKTRRLEVRLTDEQKESLDRAVAISNTTTSEFVVSHLMRSVGEAIRRNQTTELSARDMDRFLDLLDNPPPPNAALRRILKKAEDRA